MGNQQSEGSGKGAAPVFTDPFLQGPHRRFEQLRAAFDRATVEQDLDWTAFNEVLRGLERSELALRRTPLGQRMFARAAAGQPKVAKSKAWSEVVAFLEMNREQRMIYSLSLHDPRGSGQISKETLLDFCTDTAASAVQLLREKLGARAGSAAPPLSDAVLEQVSSPLRAVMAAEFDLFDVARRGVWSAQEFKNWCASSKRDGIVVEAEGLRVQTLFHLANFSWAE